MASTFGVIMAGGSGTRFWPLSRALRPKQLLPLGGGQSSLLRETLRRIEALIPPERTLVVTSEALAAQTRAQLPEVPPENILAEPVGRNTAPCVGWAASVVARTAPDALLAVLPADHDIADQRGFVRVLEWTRARAPATWSRSASSPPAPRRAMARRAGRRARSAGLSRAPLRRKTRRAASPSVSGGRGSMEQRDVFFRADTLLANVRQHLPAWVMLTFVRRSSQARRGSRARACHLRNPPRRVDRPRRHGESCAGGGGAGDFGWSEWAAGPRLGARGPRRRRKRAVRRRGRNRQSRVVRARQAGQVIAWWDSTSWSSSTPTTPSGDAAERAQDVRAVVNALKSQRRNGNLEATCSPHTSSVSTTPRRRERDMLDAHVADLGRALGTYLMRVTCGGSPRSRLQAHSPRLREARCAPACSRPAVLVEIGWSRRR